MTTLNQHTSPAYFVPQPSLYPVILSSGMFFLALGFILQMNKYSLGNWLMIAAAIQIIYVIYGWFSTVISESQNGLYQKWEDKSFRIGMVWFIASEVVFFAAFFGALYYVRIISVPELGNMTSAHGTTLWENFVGTWPSSGPGGKKFTPMGAWGIPAINTALLLSSGVTLTLAHWGLLANKRKQLILGLGATILLGLIFLSLQAYEYHHAYSELGLTMGAGAYGATFYMLTGFHGFHVCLGTIMLIVIWLRSIKGHFTVEQHFGFEGVAWYWHFVDVVWLLLFVLVYWV